MSRLERLLNLTAALLAAPQPVTGDDIQHTIPGYPDDRSAFKRQFERDKDALRGLGMVIDQVVLGVNVIGYRIPAERHYLRDPGLAPDELSALQLAARTVELQGFASVDAAWKLGHAGSGSQHRRPLTSQTAPLDVQPGRRLDAQFDIAEVPTEVVLPELFLAIAEGRRADFAYKGEQRRTNPRSLAFRNGHWYLDAFDVDRAGDRSFRVDRIDGDVTIGDLEAAPARSRSASQRTAFPWELGEGQPTKALVRIDSRQAPWAIKYLGAAAVAGESNEHGDVTVSLDVVNLDAFRSFVLGFLDGAEVLAPESLRADMIGWLTDLAAPGGVP
jgi:proteasome accessory factor B